MEKKGGDLKAFDPIIKVMGFKGLTQCQPGRPIKRPGQLSAVVPAPLVIFLLI
jgi:hypothetical protein